MGEATTRLRDRLHVRDRLLAELTAAAKERHLREDVVSTPHGPEATYVEYERTRMLTLVNAERDARGRGPLDMARVAAAERLASGHVDYAAKYALYCAELVVEP